MAVVHGDFGAAEFLFGCFYLHFHCPAKIFIGHFQCLQLVPTDGAEGAEVGVAVFKKQADEVGGQPIAEYLLGLHGALFEVAAGARADDHIKALLGDGAYYFGHLFGVVGVVAVEENDDVGLVSGGFVLQVFQSFEAGIAIAGQGLVNDSGAVGKCYFFCAVPAVVVAHDDLPHEALRDVVEYQPDGLLLVIGGNDDGDV